MPDLNSTSTQTPIVFLARGRVLTNSLHVADEFGKEHRHVLRAIDDLLSNVSKTDLPKIGQINDFNGLADMFLVDNYVDDSGRSYRCYSMDRDGFSLLAMGFTGPEALRYKMRFVAAFNMMEAALNPGSPVQTQPEVGPLPIVRSKRLNGAQMRVQLEAGQWALVECPGLSQGCRQHIVAQTMGLLGVDMPPGTGPSRQYSGEEVAKLAGQSPWHMYRDPRYKALMVEPYGEWTRTEVHGKQLKTWAWFEAGVDAVVAIYKPSNIAQFPANDGETA